MACSLLCDEEIASCAHVYIIKMYAKGQYKGGILQSGASNLAKEARKNEKK